MKEMDKPSNEEDDNDCIFFRDFVSDRKKEEAVSIGGQRRCAQFVLILSESAW